MSPLSPIARAAVILQVAVGIGQQTEETLCHLVRILGFNAVGGPAPDQRLRVLQEATVIVQSPEALVGMGHILPLE